MTRLRSTLVVALKAAAAVMGALLLVLSALMIDPLVAAVVLLGLAGLVLLSVVRLVGVRLGSMQRGGVDDFVVSTWMSLGRQAGIKLGIGGVVGVWFVIGVAIAGGIIALGGAVEAEGTSALVAGWLMLGSITVVPAVGAVLTWRWLRRRVGPRPRASSPGPRRWTRGPVTMEEHGLRLELPAGWTAHELHGGAGLHLPGVWASVQAADDGRSPRALRLLLRELLASRAPPARLLVLGDRDGMVGVVRAQAFMGMELETVAEAERAHLAADPRFTVAEPHPARSRAGRAMLLTATFVEPERPDQRVPLVVYVIEHRHAVAILTCAARRMPSDRFRAFVDGLTLD